MTLMSRPGVANRVIDIVVDAQERGLGLLAHRNGRIIAANRKLEEILETPVRPGMHLNDLVHLSPTDYSRMARAVLARSSEPYEVTIVTAAGSEKRLRLKPFQVGKVRIIQLFLAY